MLKQLSVITQHRAQNNLKMIKNNHYILGCLQTMKTASYILSNGFHSEIPLSMLLIIFRIINIRRKAILFSLVLVSCIAVSSKQYINRLV